LKRDPSLNYEVDSDEEWEEVTPSLSPAPNSVHMLVVKPPNYRNFFVTVSKSC
jgi:hypothetical protein